MPRVPTPYSASLSSAKPGRGMTFASIYSGCGGLDAGFADVEMKCVWANDIDSAAVATHNALLGDKAVAGDLLGDEVEWPETGSADLVIGGPPCQGFSVAGKMDPADPRSRHVWTFLDFVEHMQP